MSRHRAVGFGSRFDRTGPKLVQERSTADFARQEAILRAPRAERAIAAISNRTERQAFRWGSSADADGSHGDGPPHWLEGRNDRPAMTPREAWIQRRKDVKMLRRHGKALARVLELARSIEACRPGWRCMGPGCIECARATQRLFVTAGECLLSRSDIDVLAVSVVWKAAGIAEGELSDEPDVFRPLRRQLRKALRAARIRQAFGGFDISANEHAEGRFAPHYRPHAYIFVPAKQFARGEGVFRSYFPPSATVRRPVVAKPFDGSLRGLAYAHKTGFQRRVTLPRVQLPDGEVKRRNTRNRPLRARQKLEIALALDRIGLEGRIFLYGLRIGAADGRFRFVRATPKEPPQHLLRPRRRYERSGRHSS
jgi:hypothetical protein